MFGAATWIDSHRGAAAILLGHALVFWGVVGLGSPWGTMSLECAPGAIAGLVLGEGPWSLWDSYDGATGGYLLWALVGLPLYTLLGPSGWVPQIGSYAAAAGLVVLLYRFLDGWIGRRSAWIGAATVAFVPPVAFRSSLTFGDWHWTQMLFDYGLLVGILVVCGRGVQVGETTRPRGRHWLALGLLSGLAVTNSMGSVPFVVVVWLLGLLLQPALRSAVPLITTACGFALGAAPFFYKLLFHEPFGIALIDAEKTVSRLRRFDPDLSKLWDLMFGAMPSALHVEAALPSAPASVTGLATFLWVAVVWVGLALSLRAVLSARGRPDRMVAALAPCLFVGIFVLAYMVLDIRLDDPAQAFANPRHTADRSLPPLVVGLLCASAVGWGVFSGDLQARGLGPAARVVLVVALFPAVVGGASQLGLVVGALQVPASPAVYRAVCHEPLGYFASRPLKGQPAVLRERCSALQDSTARRGCLAGAAWGQGYYAAGYRFGMDDAGPRGPGGGSVHLVDEARSTCSDLDSRSRQGCLLGIGWYVGTTDWGKPSWPLMACDDLPIPADRRGCWRGVGFPLGDHLHPMPGRLRAALERVPGVRRLDAARGAGYSMGRSYASAEHALALCDPLGVPLSRGCRAGVLEAVAER